MIAARFARVGQSGTLESARPVMSAGQSRGGLEL